MDMQFSFLSDYAVNFCVISVVMCGNWKLQVSIVWDNGPYRPSCRHLPDDSLNSFKMKMEPSGWKYRKSLTSDSLHNHCIIKSWLVCRLFKWSPSTSGQKSMIPHKRHMTAHLAFAKWHLKDSAHMRNKIPWSETKTEHRAELLTLCLANTRHCSSLG